MSRVLIIAEAGVNHNGKLENAKKLAMTAKESGADIVKFQTAKLESFVTDLAPMADYQRENMGGAASQKEMLRKILLTYDDFMELSDYCKGIGIRFLSTPFDMESITFLHGMGCTLWKIPSGEITNYPYLVKIARYGQPIILSTGMSTLEEVECAVEILKNNGSGEVTLLHCTTEYPTPYKDVNLKAMRTLQDYFGCPIGYSDHTLGIEIPIAAVGMGAAVIEKHFTLDKDMEGPDHKASLEPQELKAMVAAIRNLELAMGDGEKRPVQSEMANRVVARKSIIAKRAISKGEILTEENITTKRPGNGLSPMKWHDVLGTKAIRDFIEDELVEL